MAFQAPLNLPNMASMVTDMWPSMSNVLTSPWRLVNWSSSSPPSQLSEPRMALPEESATTPSQLALPNCLETTSLHSLRFASPEYLAHRSTQGTSFLPGQKGLFGTFTFSPAKPARFSGSRQYSTFSTLQLNRRQALPKINGLLQCQQQQQRSFFGRAPQNILAHMEKTANNNPGSATAQTAFYSALLRANMPAIVVERFRSGKFATNPAAEAIYLKALQRIGGTDAVRAAAGQNNTEAQNHSLTPEQLQAVGQAVGARSSGGVVGVAANKTGTGAKESPLYVVVEETLGSSIFRWVKFIFYFGFTAYMSLVILTAVLETTGMVKNIRGGQNNEVQPQQQTVRFSDVHGCKEAKEELQELVEFLSDPERFNTLGGKLPKGVLLVGPPGTGKTLLARAVAGEAGVPFFYMSGSEFDEVYVGVGAKRVRDLFNQARSKAPAIIFIDEVDAIGGKRNERDAAYVKQTLNQLLTELDGFSQSTGVIIIAATNFPELLDKALTRPGRFDRRVVVPLPDVRGRIDILNHHMKNVQISTDVDVSIIARGTPGFSGADLENLVNQAAIRASKNKQTKVTPLDFDYAKDKIMMGAEIRSRVITEAEKVATAYHEAGHALVAYYTQGATPLYKVTITQRGQTLGVTQFLPEMDIHSRNYSEYLAQIDSAMGGRVAEELIYGPEKITSGITSDLSNATQIAFAMVTQMGYSKKLGTADLRTNYELLSSETKQVIEAEVRRILKESEERATKLLTERRKELEIVMKALVEYETITKEEMEKVLKGEKLDKLESLPNAPLVLPEPLVSSGGIPSPSGEPAASE